MINNIAKQNTPEWETENSESEIREYGWGW